MFVPDTEKLLLNIVGMYMVRRENMMNRIGIIICNYNKKEYVEKCIESLEKQSMKDFDIYVVDNASTDGSAEYLTKRFSDEIVLICNHENLGGSGGFNTGIRLVMEKKYPLIMLLDNDVVLSEGCLENCYKLMNEDKKIGMLGCEIMKMDYPDKIQEFGPIVNYETMNFELNHGGEVDKGQLPELSECDYVPACAMMVRTDVVKKIGVMPKENFIYYDDITWGIRCHRAGYKVVVTSKAKAWHKGGAAINPTTFASYYLNRNKLRFFMRYMATECDDMNVTEEQIENRAEKLIKDVFQGIYSCNHHGMPNMAKTRMEAFLDALWGVTGKADEYKIRHRETPENKFDKYVLDKKKIHLHMNGYWENTRRIVNWIYELGRQNGIEYDISISDAGQYIGDELMGIVIDDESNRSKVKAEADLHICKHIYELEIDNLDKLWVDGWRNTVIDKLDLESQKNYGSAYELFEICFKDIVVETIKRNIRNE